MELGTEVQQIVEGEVRSGFVRKVYGILSCQLILTVAVAFPIQQMNHEWIRQNIQLAQGACLASLVAVLVVTCCFRSLANKVPYNYIFLGFVTVCEAIMVGFISAMYTTQSVLLAFIMTAGIFIGLSLYAITTKNDFTGFGPYLMAFLLGLILTSFIVMFFPYCPMVQRLMAGFGAVLFSFYIVYDTQMICGGKHDTKFGVDDYVFAALTIYLDIINLFIYLLQLFGNRD